MDRGTGLPSAVHSWPLRRFSLLRSEFRPEQDYNSESAAQLSLVYKPSSNRFQVERLSRRLAEFCLFGVTHPPAISFEARATKIEVKSQSDGRILLEFRVYFVTDGDLRSFAEFVERQASPAEKCSSTSEASLHVQVKGHAMICRSEESSRVSRMQRTFRRRMIRIHRVQLRRISLAPVQVPVHIQSPSLREHHLLVPQQTSRPPNFRCPTGFRLSAWSTTFLPSVQRLRIPLSRTCLAPLLAVPTAVGIEALCRTHRTLRMLRSRLITMLGPARPMLYHKQLPGCTRKHCRHNTSIKRLIAARICSASRTVEAPRSRTNSRSFH